MIPNHVEPEDIYGLLLGVAFMLGWIAYDTWQIRRIQHAQLVLLQQQHIRATSPDPVARPSSHERLSSEKSVG